MRPDRHTGSAEDFWEGIYGNASSRTSGLPSTILKRFATGRAPGHALDLGCAKGDDVVWLAKQGWRVLGVDISAVALGIAAKNAARNDVADHIVFERHDLSKSFPDGKFDLVSAMFLQTPFDFPCALVLRAAASAVRPSGLLLVATHQTHAPWSWSAPNEREISAQDRFLELDLEVSHWRQVFVGPIHRKAKGPGGQQADVTDAVLALERV
ncbi:bifunctional 2-polyprenyl-6-hydroxyphenol methylase/3-demethylubiquinol 3-O-methyltransferase UbiG [uncultured Tateyamaria sp.]|uniref:class I SAM-dependent methyltransferase n=1 Tax=uncultured Tateyamaria sp. TaxID=455651 RepID=UPI002610732A|nr:class I SAM-dependent methyltransferase [uncultured Tateyamaria sp.]